MPTIRLVPSTYYLSSSSYLSITDPQHMYANTDNETYATVHNSRSSTTSYYIYLRGFNFNDVPVGAVVTSFKIKLKARETSVSTSSSYKPYLANGTTAINGSCSALGTSVSVHEFTGISADWNTIVSYGSNFGIRINTRRASRNTASYVYIYGAEIEVTYTIPVSHNVTTTLTGDGTIDPEGVSTALEGNDFIVTITPTNKSDQVTATKDGVDITDQLIAHKSGGGDSRVLGTYTHVSGSFDSGESYFEGLEGNGVDAAKTTSNYYSSSSNTQAVFTYDLSFNIPSDATVTKLFCQVNGHAESTSQSSEYMCVQLKSGNTALSEQINFKNVSTSNTTITLEATTLPTPAQLASLVLECELGYYGGALNGATCYVEYETSGGSIDHYTYVFTVTDDTTIAIVIGNAGPEYAPYAKIGGTWKRIGTASVLYLKTNGGWVQASKVYIKQNGSWVEKDVPSIF